MSNDITAHYERLLSAGYSHKVAEDFVSKIYGVNFRDLLLDKKEPEKGLGESDPSEIYDKHPKTVATEEEKIEGQTTFSVNQKILSTKDMGIVRNVGTRFVTVEWLTDNNKERMALRTFKAAVDDGEIFLIPLIRTARKKNG